MRVQLRRTCIAATITALMAAGASCGGGGGGGQDRPRVGTIRGRLAAPAPSAAPGGLTSFARNALSLDQVSIDLVTVDASGPTPTTTVVATATPDAAGAFAFTAVEEGTYGLRVNQPEFATVAYGVTSTTLSLFADQTVSVVLPLITTLVHGFVDPTLPASAPTTDVRPLALDRTTGKVVLVTPAGLAIVDPDAGTVDALRSQSLFDGVARIALPPTRGLVWILYGDRIVRVDRSIFTNPAASEAIDLESVTARAQVGDKVRYRLLAPPPGLSTLSFTGQIHFSPDEKVLFASVSGLLSGIEGGVVVLDLEALRVLDVIPGNLAGYNPASNQLFLEARAPGSRDVSLSVVDATTRFDVMPPVTVENFLGLTPFHASTRTLLLGSQLNTSNVEIPFVTVVDRSPTDGSGLVATPSTRAKEWLGVANDPVAATPAFDAAGKYLTIGDAAYRLLTPSGFQEVTGGIPADGNFLAGFSGCNRERPVDTVNLYRLWFGCSTSTPSIGLVSLDRANVPIAVRPGVDTLTYLLDEDRGRAIFRGDRQLVFVHYADPSATARPERLDLSSVVAPWVALGAQCSDAASCAADELCLAPTPTSGSGRCTPNPRLPFRPLCGGFPDRACDAGFTCSYVNDLRHQMGGKCVGLPDRDFATKGPPCGAGDTCPSGMACGSGRCAPKSCLRDADCTAPGEICGLVQNLGRVCLAPGTLPDGAHCLDAGECAHGACVPVESGAAQWSGIPATMVGDAYGYRGLMACTTPCFEQADCPPGGHCGYRAPEPTPPDSWRTHRVELAPYCSPPVVPPELLACAATCGPAQLCRVPMGAASGACHVGYSPETGAPSAPNCLAPAVTNPWLAGCGFRCERSGDCPWTTSCQEGVCATDDRPGCTTACGATESCVPAWESPTPGVPFICQALESCFNQADCSAGTCLQDACYVQECTTNADCGTGECVRFPDPVTPSSYVRFCATSTRCGCTGPETTTGICDGRSNSCIVEP